MLSAYPVITDIVVRWHEVDSLGIVNNAVYYHYFETARIQYHERLGLPAPTQRTGDEGVILASNSCRYRIPVTYPDALSIGSRVTSVGDDHFTMEYAALSQEQGKIVAIGEALVVMYNYLERRPAAMSKDLHAAIVALEGRELPAAPPRRRRKDTTQ